jgi:hypothetical protein
MRERKGVFALTVTESDKWINFADLSDDKTGEIMKGVIEEAKEHANRQKEWVVVYIAGMEIEIHPKE